MSVDALHRRGTYSILYSLPYSLLPVFLRTRGLLPSSTHQRHRKQASLTKISDLHCVVVGVDVAAAMLLSACVTSCDQAVRCASREFANSRSPERVCVCVGRQTDRQAGRQAGREGGRRGGVGGARARPQRANEVCREGAREGVVGGSHANPEPMSE